jgi:superfamily II RNA helicase
MAGRAGRRKIDTEGFVYCRVNPRYLSFQGLTQIIYGKPEIVRSKFNTSYATTLHFYEKFLENLYEVYRLSFHYFKEKRHSQKRAIELLDSKIKILKELGYIKDKKLTEKGKFASKIYGYELPISELYEKGILEELSEIELGVLCLALVFEPRKNIMKPRLSKRTKKLITITERVLSYIHRTEKRLKITPLSKKYYYHLSPCIEAWMRGEEFDKILWYTNVDEGEIVRYFRMTIQVLREILDTPVNPMFKEKIRKTIHLINRDIINAEQELNM